MHCSAKKDSHLTKIEEGGRGAKVVERAWRAGCLEGRKEG
jgi:hypothetical protein